MSEGLGGPGVHLALTVETEAMCLAEGHQEAYPETGPGDLWRECRCLPRVTRGLRVLGIQLPAAEDRSKCRDVEGSVLGTGVHRGLSSEVGSIHSYLGLPGRTGPSGCSCKCGESGVTCSS